VSREAKLRYLAHLLTENRHGLIIDTAVTAASRTAERDAAVVMLGELPLTTRRLTVGGRQSLRYARLGCGRPAHGHPHVAQNEFWCAGARSTRGRFDTWAIASVTESGRWLSKRAGG